MTARLPDSTESTSTATTDVVLPRALTVTARVLSVAAGVVLLGLMALTIADVLSRNLRDRSIVGTVDIATILLVAVAFLGLASAEIDGRHVTVELVESRFGQRVRMIFSALRAVFLVGLGALLIWGLNEVLLSAVDRGETTNDILRLPTWPAKLVLLISFLAFFVAAVWKEIVVLAALRSEQSGADR